MDQSFLEQILGEMAGAVVAFSGGADSAFLAKVASDVLGDRCLMVTADSPSIPRSELRAAEELALHHGWPHQVVSTTELDDERYASNPKDRCYFCKSHLFDVIVPIAEARGWETLLGTNLDDLGDWRPGQVAAGERGARHPLVEASFSKDDVRRRSRELGLETADKPAAACLASRFAYGVRVTREGLERVETAEELLKGLDYAVVRVRDLGGNRVRVEVGSDEVSRLMQEGPHIVELLSGLGFKNVSLDEKGYRQGALNEGLILEPLRIHSGGA